MISKGQLPPEFSLKKKGTAKKQNQVALREKGVTVDEEG